MADVSGDETCIGDMLTAGVEAIIGVEVTFGDDDQVAGNVVLLVRIFRGRLPAWCERLPRDSRL